MSTFVSANELFSKYSSLLTQSMRDNIANFVTTHIYKVHDSLKQATGSTPFPADEWQSWENLNLPSDKTVTMCKKMVPKYKEESVVENGETKTVKVKTDELEEKEKRLYKNTQFNAHGKSALAFVLASLVQEAQMVAGVTTSNTDSIKQSITTTDGCPYRVSPVIFALCEKYDDSRLSDALPVHLGTLRTKLMDAVGKEIKESVLSSIVSDSFFKFLQIFTINLASDLWFETKKSTEDELLGKTSTTSDKQVRQELVRASNLLLSNADKLTGEFLNAMTEFHEGVESVTKEKKLKLAEEKKRKSEEKAATESAKPEEPAKVVVAEPPKVVEESPKVEIKKPTVIRKR